MKFYRRLEGILRKRALQNLVSMHRLTAWDVARLFGAQLDSVPAPHTITNMIKYRRIRNPFRRGRRSHTDQELQALAHHIGEPRVRAKISAASQIDQQQAPAPQTSKKQGLMADLARLMERVAVLEKERNQAIEARLRRVEADLADFARLRNIEADVADLKKAVYGKL
jgi:cell division protein FtsB